MIHGFSQPEYILRFDVAGCAYAFRVNEAPIHEDRDGLPGIVELSLNPWILTGMNSVSMQLLPHPSRGVWDEDTSCVVTIYVRQHHAPPAERLEVARLEYHFRQQPPPPTGPLLRSTSFSASLPQPPWSWIAAPRADSGANIRPPILEAGLTFHELLAAKAIEDILHRVELRDRETASAHYRDLQKQRESTRRDFVTLLTSPEWVLTPWNENSVQVSLYCDGRVARLEDQEGQSPLSYEHRSGELVSLLPLMFHQTDAGSWIICR